MNQTQINTIREALEEAAKMAMKGVYDIVWMKAVKAFAALDQLAAESKPQKPVEDAQKLVDEWWVEWMDSIGPDSLHEICAHKLAHAITARDNRVREETRQECADRAMDKMQAYLIGNIGQDEYISFITGEEAIHG